MKLLRTIYVSVLGIAMLASVFIRVSAAEEGSHSGKGVKIITPEEGETAEEIVQRINDALEAEQETGSEPSLHFTTRTSEEIAGYFGYKDSRVVFEGHIKTPSQALVQIQVNDLVLDASAELGEASNPRTIVLDAQGKLVSVRVIVFDGHGKALLPDQKQALMVLTGLLEQHYDLQRRTLPLPAHEQLLIQAVAVFGEAPVGFPITRNEVRFP